MITQTNPKINRITIKYLEYIDINNMLRYDEVNCRRTDLS